MRSRKTSNKTKTSRRKKKIKKKNQLIRKFIKFSKKIDRSKKYRIKSLFRFRKYTPPQRFYKSTLINDQPVFFVCPDLDVDREVEFATRKIEAKSFNPILYGYPPFPNPIMQQRLFRRPNLNRMRRAPRVAPRSAAISNRIRTLSGGAASSRDIRRAKGKGSSDSSGF